MGNPHAKATVVLTDPETGSVRVFEAGDQLTDWAVAAITNPEVLDQDDTDEAPSDKPKATRTRRKAPAK